jgi:hypothetical protein
LVTLFFSFSKRKEKGGKKKLEEKFGYFIPLWGATT